MSISLSHATEQDHDDIHTPFGSHRLPDNPPPEISKPDNAAPITLEGWAFNTAISRRCAMHPQLIRLLDAAPKTGQPATWSLIRDHMPSHTTNGGNPVTPSTWDGWIDDFHMMMPEEVLWVTLRDWYGWTIPTAETIQAITHTLGITQLLEFGQGTGYFASILAAAGVRILTSECFNRGYDGIGIWKEPDYNDSAAMISSHPDIPILISWPDPRADNVILNLIRPGQTLIITGNTKYCGLQPQTLRQHGFTHQSDKTQHAVAPSATGGLTDINIWTAPG